MNPLIATDLLCEQITAGAYDTDLQTINKALQQRALTIRSIKAQDALATINVGDRVTLDGLKPRYVNGSTPLVVKINQTRAVVILEKPKGRFMGEVTVPLACITPTKQEVAV